MKKILFLTHVGDPGGAEFMMINLCKSLDSNAEVMHFQNGSLEKILMEKGIVSSVCPISHHIIKFKRQDGLRSLFSLIPSIFSIVKKLAKKCKKFDVIICMSQKSFILATLAKPFMRKPIIWFMNDILSRDHFGQLSLFIIPILSRLGANHVILNSKASLVAWKSSGCSEKNVTVIYPGVNTEELNFQLQDQEKIDQYKKKFSPDGKPLIGIFGRLAPWKGQDIFLKSISNIQDINGVIVGGALFGEDDYETYLKELTKKLNIGNRITFAGHINDVPKVMAACDIIVHCSTAPEPFGLVIVEAMMVGIPVIASDAGGAKEIIFSNDLGTLTPIGDFSALAKAITKYINNKELTTKISKNAKKVANECFSLTSMANNFKIILAKF